MDAKRKRFLREKFEELLENTRIKGTIAEDAQKEAEKYLIEFLKAGLNANRVSGLLSREKRLKHRTLLIKYGARVNVATVAK